MDEARMTIIILKIDYFSSISFTFSGIALGHTI